MATADPADASLTGQRLGPWVLAHRIGRGGLGEVWHAQRDDGLYDGQVAIKLLHGDGASPAVARRFRRERAALGQLAHPHIAALLDAGLQGSHAYLVLELVDGPPLAEHARSLNLAARVALLLQVAEAVEHAHGRLVVHRDLKPANVRVDALGGPKLLDFGLAVSPDFGAGEVPAGLTPGYAAPELITDDDGGTGVDVFSLGVMLFELITGCLPFGHRQDNPTAMTHAVLHQPPHRLEALLRQPADADGPGRPVDAHRARGDLEAIALRALAKAPGERYVGVHAFIEDLQHWQARRPVLARRGAGWRHRAGLWVRRHTLPAALAGAVAVSLVAGMGVSLWQWQQAEAARRRADTVAAFLTDLLRWDDHQPTGRTPTVLELMDASRDRLDHQFADDPATRARLLEVLSRTYTLLNRFDDALALGTQWLNLARELHGEDEPVVLRARLALGQTHQIMGNHDVAIGLLEPLAEPLARHFGPDSEEVRQQNFILSADYMHSRRLDEAERALERVRVLTEKLHGDDPYERADYLLNLGVLRRLQGRTAESLAVVRETRPLWRNPDPRLTMPVLVLRRHEMFMMAQNAEFTGLDERGPPLLADIRRAMGAGNEFENQTASIWATCRQLRGDHLGEVDLRRQLLATAREDGLAPEALLVPRAELLLAQARNGRLDLPAAERLMAEAAALQGGGRRSRTLLLLADAALAVDRPALAAQALQQLRQRPLPAALAAPGSRLDRVEGRLARAQGDLTLSRQRLLTVRETGAIESWAAALDLALTAVLQAAPDAAGLLAKAQARRPATLPAGHPLDAVTAWLQARQAAGNDDAPDVREAWAQLAAARAPGAPPPSRASLGGLLL